MEFGESCSPRSPLKEFFFGKVPLKILWHVAQEILVLLKSLKDFIGNIVDSQKLVDQTS